jgi:hypothetical protein
MNFAYNQRKQFTPFGRRTGRTTGCCCGRYVPNIFGLTGVLYQANGNLGAIYG